MIIQDEKNCAENYRKIFNKFKGIDENKYKKYLKWKNKKKKSSRGGAQKIC